MSYFRNKAANSFQNVNCTLMFKLSARSKQKDDVTVEIIATFISHN